MGRLAARCARSALVVAVVVLPWAGTAQTDEAPESVSSAKTDATAIEMLSPLLVVTAGRPTLSPQTKRTDGLRLVSTLPPSGLGLDPVASLGQLTRHSGSTGWTEPMAMHLAGRGPPTIVGA